MPIAKELERLQRYPESASKEFREQLDRAKKQPAALPIHQDSNRSARGVDRSGDFAPLPKPAIVRSLATEIS